MLSPAKLTFQPVLEVCVDGVVAETIDNVGLVQEFTGTPDSLTHALVIVATPSRSYSVNDLELLAVVKVFNGQQQVGRLTARFSPEQHQVGPYEVFSDDVILVSQLHAQDTLYATAHYTRTWPRAWTHMRMEVNMYALSLLLPA